jgi:hypothetical protein
MSLDTPFTSSGLTDPTITLKRGKVEISIKNATAIVQRMEELFPKNPHRGYSWTPSQQKNYDHDKNKAWLVAARNWFKQELYGTDEDNFDIIISDNDDMLTSEKQTPPFEEDRKPSVLPCPPPAPLIEKTVNKNAYEIRESILEKSIDIVKYSTMGSKCDTDTMVNKILDVASKLYEFVENKKGRR